MPIRQACQVGLISKTTYDRRNALAYTFPLVSFCLKRKRPWRNALLGISDGISGFINLHNIKPTHCHSDGHDKRIGAKFSRIINHMTTLMCSPQPTLFLCKTESHCAVALDVLCECDDAKVQRLFLENKSTLTGQQKWLSGKVSNHILQIRNSSHKKMTGQASWQ